MAIKIKKPVKFQGKKLTLNKSTPKVPAGSLRDRGSEYIFDRLGNYIQQRNQ